MPSGRNSVVIASATGLLLGVTTYLLVAPFTCDPDGVCHGWVAFDYQPGVQGQWQALGAGVLVGAMAALLLWLILAPASGFHSVVRTVMTPLLIAGVGISVLSQSALLAVGPLVGGLSLWLMWRLPRTVDSSEEDPFAGRA